MKTEDIKREMTDREQKINEILNGVFLHGRDTSNISHQDQLPKGQYTIADALAAIIEYLEGER